MSLKRGILYTFLTQAPTLLMYFVASMLMTRMLGDVGRGEYALLTNDGALLAMLVGLNLAFGVSYFTAKNTGDVKKLVGTAATFLILDLLFIPMFLFGISLSDALTDLSMPVGRTHWAYWAFLYLMVMCSLVNGTISAVLLGLKQFKVLNAMSILNAALSAIGFLFLYLYKEQITSSLILPSVLMISAAVLVIQSLTWCVLYGIIVKVPPIPVWSWSIIKPILIFSLIGHLSTLVNLINYRFDVWVVDHYCGPAELGLYAVAVGVGQLLFHIPDPFARVVQPFLFGQVKDEMLARFKVVARLSFTSVLLIGIGLAFTAQWILPLLFGDVFIGSVSALWLLLPGILFSSGFKVLAQLVINSDMQRFNLLATSVGALFTIILDLIMIPRWGIEGAALASTISYLLILLVVVGVIRTRLNISVHDLFILRSTDIALLRNFRSWKRTP